jgi:hypothetical protein
MEGRITVGTGGAGMMMGKESEARTQACLLSGP